MDAMEKLIGKYPEKTLEDIAKFSSLVERCPEGGMVFFGGAGVSTESGIPDFRSADGLYAQQYDYPPETIISASFFWDNPKVFYKFYTSKMIALDARPNAAHLKLAQLEEEGKLSAVVTQNIDGLHQAAGSKNVLELHGSVLRNNCTVCHKFADVNEFMEAHEKAEDGIARCSCGGMLKPDVVLYEEALNDRIVNESVKAIARADLLVIAGTSLAVYPAAGLIDFFRGSHLVIINRTPTPRDDYADLCIAANVGDVFSVL